MCSTGGRPDLVVTLDATGQHDATQIPHLIDQLLADDLDVIIGSRWAKGSGTPGLTLRRWTLGRAANLAFRWVTGIRGVTDVTTTFRIARIEVVQGARPRRAATRGACRWRVHRGRGRARPPGRGGSIIYRPRPRPSGP